MKNNPTISKVVTIGGGTGSIPVLSALKNLEKIYPIAICPTTDSGGSSGKLISQFGILPPGDIRNCLIALSTVDEKILVDLFNFRFEVGEGLKGHNFGNLLLTALTKILKNDQAAIKFASELLKIKGEVLPVSKDKPSLCAEYENGNKLIGEHFIDEPEFPHDGRMRIKKIYTEPSYRATGEVLKSIEESEYIIICPGDLYTSIIPILLAEGITDSIKKSNAKIIYFINLFTKFGQTHDFQANDFVTELNKYLKSDIDSIVIHKGYYSEESLIKYGMKYQFPIQDNLHEDSRVIRADLVMDNLVDPVHGDLLFRSIVRHDSEKISKILQKLLV